MADLNPGNSVGFVDGLYTAFSTGFFFFFFFVVDAGRVLAVQPGP
jgi:hypothetical protein